MKAPRGLARLRRRVLVGLLLTLGQAGMPAQSASEATIKAGFLYNFAKFTEWPETILPPNAVITFCVSDAAVAEALRALVAGRSIDSHRIAVTRIRPDDLLSDCALVYASDLDSRAATRLLNGLKGSSVLSVSDFSGFTDAGGVIRFFRAEGQLRFAINVEAAEKAQLALGSQLLSLATLVKD
jgi:hypothetical protein